MRDAEVGPESSVLVESPLTTRTRRTSMPAVWAAICASAMSEPVPMSGVPQKAVTTPSASTLIRAVDGLRTPL